MIQQFSDNIEPEIIYVPGRISYYGDAFNSQVI